ncbi:MAG: 5-methylcytosine-specific restriction endonuclease system specificity protein McrC [Lachnospiraceae bacterium]
MIPIKNIYYMLSYAFQILQTAGYRDMALEEFDNAKELCAAILIQGMENLQKRGLEREYVSNTEQMSQIRGKIELSQSIVNANVSRRQLICSYDEFSSNHYENQIMKTTMEWLLRADISRHRKRAIKQLLFAMDGIDTVDWRKIQWSIVQNPRSKNKNMQMLLSICYMVLEGLIQTGEDGRVHMQDYFDEQRMSRLYEKFLLEYYKKEFPNIKVHSGKISWQLDDGNKELLPTMQSDIMLEYKDKILIIDAKYYAHTTQSYFSAHKIHSDNLYQIFTYVKNKAEEQKSNGRTVAGLLLYAGTDEEIWPNQTYHMSGNRISVKTLDLNCMFDEICRQLRYIIEEM